MSNEALNNEVDKSFADYMKFLEKKDKSRDERMSEAEENREGYPKRAESR